MCECVGGWGEGEGVGGWMEVKHTSEVFLTAQENVTRCYELSQFGGKTKGVEK